MNKLPEANFFDLALLLFDYRIRYRVEGDSMTPTLKPGEQVLVDENAEPKAGDIVIARHPFKTGVDMVKRIREINKNGNFFLISDNLDGSSDSRSFGAVSSDLILGKVTGRLSD
jgi:nickel-type superoxide dismutase maturation protease